MTKGIRTAVILLLAIVQYLSCSTMVFAQYDLDLGDTSSIDTEPPLIEHEVLPDAEADIRQTFIATVVDDNELDRVELFYRYAGESTYSRYVMLPVSFTSTFVAQIATDPDATDTIEYYIQATDMSGNRTVRGYAFSPLRRVLEAPQLAQPEATPVSEEPVSEPAVSRKVWYVAGAVVVLGLVASALSSGSSGGGDSSEPPTSGNCDTAGCRLTVTVGQPF